MSEEFTTTFWQDFTIADAFGNEAILYTFDQAFKDCKDDHHLLTDLVIALNHKMWQHDERWNENTSRLYEKLWRQAHNYALNNLKGTQLRYYLDMTD